MAGHGTESREGPNTLILNHLGTIQNAEHRTQNIDCTVDQPPLPFPHINLDTVCRVSPFFFVPHVNFPEARLNEFLAKVNIGHIQYCLGNLVANISSSCPMMLQPESKLPQGRADQSFRARVEYCQNLAYSSLFTILSTQSCDTSHQILFLWI